MHTQALGFISIQNSGVRPTAYSSNVHIFVTLKFKFKLFFFFFVRHLCGETLTGGKEGRLSFTKCVVDL